MAGPIALGLDLVARHFVFRGQPQDLQEFMGSFATRYVWYVAPLVLLGGVIGFVRYPSMLTRARATIERRTPQELQGAELKTLLIATSFAQAPALLGDLGVMLGARLLPAMCSTGLSVFWVWAIGARAIVSAR